MSHLAERIRSATPKRARRKILNARFGARVPTSNLRALPDFLIIGAQRGGTSSLYRYLGDHPQIVPSLRKETEYLSRRYASGISWYKAHFPLRARLVGRTRLTGTKTLTFEATPDYIYYTHAPARAAAILPEAKIIVLLRDPVERAHSHYQHMVRLGFETMTFEEALAAEENRIQPDLDALDLDPLHYCRDSLRFSYVSRGFYLDQLTGWMEHFPRERFMIASSEDFFADPAGVYREILSFLDLRSWTPANLANFSYPSGRTERASSIDAATRHRLVDIFRPHNERLFAFLDRDLGWNI